MAQVTMRDVAKAAEVSVATVSHVLNGTHYVSPDLRKKVEDAIRTLNYRPNKIARALNTKGVPFLALIVPDISNPYWSTVAKAVQDITDKQDYLVIVFSTDGIYEREVRFLRSLSGWVSGVIFHPYHVSQEEVKDIVGDDLPMVIIGDFTSDFGPEDKWDHVISSNLECSEKMVEYLIQLGHTRIAFIKGSEGTPSSAKRFEGYLKAFENVNIPLVEEIIVQGDYTREGGRNGMKSLLSQTELPTAVFCANDFSALGALEVALSHGLQVPKDISIVGFDDIDEAMYASPPLTTIRQSPANVGTIAAENLIERLEGRERSLTVQLKGSLIVRESTAPPRVA